MAEERKVPRVGGSRTLNRDGMEIEPIPAPKSEPKVEPKPEVEVETKPATNAAPTKSTKRKPRQE